MSFDKMVLPADELIVRLLKRPPRDAGKMPIIRAADFGRLMHRHSGVSMHRASAKAAARERWPVTGLKGILIAKAGPIQALGLTFYHTGNDHFSVRCAGCDLSQNQFDQTPLCTVPGAFCDFDPSQIQVMHPAQITPLSILDKLVPLFDVDTIPH
jgi:hypothetical protein